MKLKLLFSVVFVCTLFTTSYAQINKGSAWIGSSFSYSQIKNDYAPTFSDQELRITVVQPAWGVAIKENLVVGIFGTYYKAHTKGENVYNYQEKRYGGGIFIRRYVPIFNRFYIFGDGRLGYNTTEMKYKWEMTPGGASSQKWKGWGTNLALTPGISYEVTKNLQLEAAVSSLFNASYSSSKETSSTYQDQKSKSFNAGVNLENLKSFSIGFRLLLNKKA